MAAPRKLSPEREAKVVKAYQNGDSLAAITGKYEISAGTVRTICLRNNVALRPVGRPKAAAPAV